MKRCVGLYYDWAEAYQISTEKRQQESQRHDNSKVNIWQETVKCNNELHVCNIIHNTVSLKQSFAIDNHAVRLH